MAKPPAKSGAAKVRMEDIARLAGVSKSTVSRALSDSPLISRKTRDQIRKIADQNQYRVNEGARNLRLQNSRTIAVVVFLEARQSQHISDPFFLDLLGSIADALSEKGYDLLLSRLAPGDAPALRNLILSDRVEGVILFGQSTMHDALNELADEVSQFVVWGGLLPDQKYCTVGSDNAGGAYMAVRHLIRLGRKNILFLGDRNLPEVQLRYDGYVRALNEAGIAVRPEYAIKTPFASEGARQNIQKALAENLHFDAVFAASDLIAMSAINALTMNGVAVPKDVSVVGYDDITLAAYYTPALTTVRQNTSVGGYILVEHLLKRLEGEVVQQAVLPTELVVRSSCGA